MPTFVAFLRAVNLGKRTARSSQLVDAVASLGFEHVWTYIASGNVVFDAPRATAAQLEAQLGAAFEAALGFEATTFVRTPTELRAALALEPFAVADRDTYFITFLKDRPDAAARRALEGLSNDYDTLTVDGRDVHWRMHGLSSASPLKAKDWDAIVGKHRSTSRNTTMLRKLLVKLDERSG